MTGRIILVASLLSLSAFAYEANLNIDWKFKKIGSDLYGLDAALKAGAKDGRQVFDLDYDESGMERVSVPHCVNAHDSYDNRACDRGEAAFWRGWMLYRKMFRVPEGKDTTSRRSSNLGRTRSSPSSPRTPGRAARSASRPR